MQTNGAESDTHGYALLIAASPHGRNPVMNAADALPALSAIPPGLLLGTATASVVQLADPDDPNTVLTHLRTAAAHEGPLLVYLSGQIVLDTRQQLPHLSLAKSTPRTVRYTGMPWHWLPSELRHRRPGTTTVLADLVAGGDFWEQRGRHSLADGLTLYGTVVPQPPRRRSAPPVYSHALASVLRTAAQAGMQRPSDEELHHRALTEAGLAGAAAERTMVLGGPGVPGNPQPGHGYSADEPAPAAPASGGDAGAPAVPPPMPQSPPPSVPDGFGGTEGDPLEAVFEAAHRGRHGEASAIAAAWEQAALRSGGPDSPGAVHWVEVRADLARIAGDADRSCRLWLQAASARLRSGQEAGDSEVFGAVDRAHHCWHQITDPATASELGAALAELRERVPGHRPGALQDVHDRLADLNAVAPARVRLEKNSG